MNIVCPISFNAAQSPRDTAIIPGSGSLTYLQLHNYVSTVTSTLQNMGVKKGSRCALTGHNSLEFVAALLALWRLKATAIPLSFRLPNYYINKILKKTNASFLVSNPNSNTASNPTANTYDIENNLSWKDFPTAPTGKSTNISHESAPKILPVPMEPESEATVILTSGSTGSEKAALHTYGNHFYNALGSNENITLEPGDRWLLSLPLFHVGGLGILFRCFLAGAAVVIPEKSATLSLSLTKHKITHASMVSTQLVTLMENKITKSHLKALLLGGSAFPEALIRKALSLNLPIYTTYGLSEMASQVTTTSKNDTAPTPPPGRLTSSGKILNFRTIKIENNEILVKGKTLFKGYLEKDSISIPLTKDGWFGTGDLGAIDAYGYLRVSGRKDNMFISGGENIMPEEIEALLLEIPGIQQAVVAPYENKKYGCRPAAFLKLTGSNPANPGFHPTGMQPPIDIKFLEEKLPKFKIPDLYFPWPVDSREGGLKIKRPVFKEILQKIIFATE